MKILAINPRLIISKDFNDYPFFVNLNLYHAINYIRALDEWNVHLDIIDAFADNDSWVKQYEQNKFLLWNSEKKQILSNKSKYDYIIINVSPFLFYNLNNIELLNNLIISYKDKDIKIILFNGYIWSSCYIEFSEDDIIKKWIKFDYLINWKPEKLLEIIYPDKIHTEYRIDFSYRNIERDININNYISFLKNASDFWLMSFYSSSLKSLPYITSIGCIFNCSFCTSNNKNIKWFTPFGIDNIKKDIDYLIDKYWIERIIILDSLFNSNKSRTKDILNYLLSKNIKISIPNWVRLDLLDEEIISLLAWLTDNLSVSIEHWDEHFLNTVIWKKITFNQIEECCKLSKKYNIKLYAHFIIWFPEEDKSLINKTLEYAYRLYIKYWITPLLQYLIPIPWTNYQKNIWESSLFNHLEAFQWIPSIQNDHFSKDDLKIFMDNFLLKISNSNHQKIIINITYLCNNNCEFCAIWNRIKKDQEFILIIKKLIFHRKKWVKLLDIDWWEPTLYKNLDKIIKYAKKLWYFINLTSNWRNFSNYEYLENIVSIWIDNILVSLHSNDKNIHDSITNVKWSYNETIQGIWNIKKLQKDYKFTYWVNMTLCKKNQDNINEYLDFLGNIEPWVLNIQFPTPFWNYVIDDFDIEKAASNLKQMLGNLSYDINIVNLPFCYMSWFEKFIVWDIWKNNRKMIFIWQEEENLARYLSTKREYKEVCNDCLYKIICDWFYE